jgi:environmental stress-induced protein Ves
LLAAIARGQRGELTFDNAAEGAIGFGDQPVTSRSLAQASTMFNAITRRQIDPHQPSNRAAV